MVHLCDPKTLILHLLIEWQKDLVRKLGEDILEVEIKGIIAISNEDDVCLGLEIEVPGTKN